MVTAPDDEQDTVDVSPNPVSVPSAPTVTICANFRPLAPPKEIGGCVCAPPCCSRADTRTLKSWVTTCGGDAESVTCAVNVNVPVAVGALLHPFVCRSKPGAGELRTTLQVRVPTPFDAPRQNVLASRTAASGNVVVVMTIGFWMLMFSVFCVT